MANIVQRASFTYQLVAKEKADGVAAMMAEAVKAVKVLVAVQGRVGKVMPMPVDAVSLWEEGSTPS